MCEKRKRINRHRCRQHPIIIIVITSYILLIIIIIIIILLLLLLLLYIFFFNYIILFVRCLWVALFSFRFTRQRGDCEHL